MVVIHRGRGRTANLQTVPAAYNRIIRLWALRCIDMTGALSSPRDGRRDLSYGMFRFAGIEPLFPRMVRHREKPDEGLDAAFRQVLARSEAEALSIPTSTVMAKNIRVLGNALGLNQVEQDLIHLVVLSRLQLSLQECLDSIGGLNRAALITLFARVLNLKAIDVARALDSSSFLMRGGLLELDDAGNYPFSNKVDLLVGISDQLSTPQRHELGLFRNSFHIAPKPSLGLEDYPHLSTDLAILLPYLREALWTRKKGVNILVHGSPGTGKTEFARAAAKRLGSTLHEVACEDLRREPVEGQERFRGYRLAQGILANGRENLILFDEIEDVFRPQEDKLRGRPSNQSGMKGWVNRVLEDNQVPAFWITNRLHVLDEAFVRRFDLVIELNVPPRCVRKRILDARLQSLDVSEAVKARLADHEGLSPAVITRAASVIQDALSDGLSLEVGEALSHVIGRTLESMGHRAMAPAGCQSPTSYRPEVLNTDCNLDQVLGGLRQHGSGRLCLYGPPGTGKSAWGRHVAQKMDRPLLLKRASDLLDKYVGGTEVRIAAMFREAQAEKAVLLLDEADSFLQDRRQAQQSWEVTQVNELLTQMEAFEGVFIASTNLMDQLDAAALRRFDFKVKFTFLNPEQARILFLDATTQLGLNPTGEHLNHLDHLRKLTPGDFATVLRQARMAPPSDVPALLHRLEAECRLKPEARSKPIGFGPVAYETSTSLRINPSTQTGRSHGIH